MRSTRAVLTHVVLSDNTSATAERSAIRSKHNNNIFVNVFTTRYWTLAREITRGKQRKNYAPTACIIID